MATSYTSASVSCDVLSKSAPETGIHETDGERTVFAGKLAYAPVDQKRHIHLGLCPVKVEILTNEETKAQVEIRNAAPDLGVEWQAIGVKGQDTILGLAETPVRVDIVWKTGEYVVTFQKPPAAGKALVMSYDYDPAAR